MTDPTLFDEPAARASDPATSHAAAHSLTPGRTERAILDVMRAEPCISFTADMLDERLPRIRQDTLRSALSRLKNADAVVAVGTGTSRSGRPMTLWTAR